MKSPTLPWKKTFDVTHRHLQALIQTSINTAHFPTPFKTITTAVLRETSQPGLHPIAPENILGKLIESVMTELLSYAVEEHQLIPVQHYGGRPGRTGEKGTNDHVNRGNNTRVEGKGCIFGCIYGRRGHI